MNFVNSAIDRVAEIMEGKSNLPTGVCPRMGDCNYVVEQAEKGNIRPSQKNGYEYLVCGKYHGACELNIQRTAA